jgi:uncharacterized membrane protein
MIWLLLGLAIWIAAHTFKRVAPGPRATLQERMGDASKGLFAAALLLSVVLMVVGYRAAEFVPVWQPPSWGVHLNNLMMVFAIALFGLGNSKSRLRGTLRHPQLTGFSLWAVAHLLVNGDVASLVLWGVLLILAIAEMPLINMREPAPPRFTGGSLAGDVRLVFITLVVYAVISAIHAWLGVWPFPS